MMYDKDKMKKGMYGKMGKKGMSAKGGYMDGGSMMESMENSIRDRNIMRMNKNKNKMMMDY